jgi:hypothetical protein
MAKVAKKNGTGAFVLELIASLIFFGIAWAWGVGAAGSSWSWIQSIFYAAAVVGSVTLFIGSFGNLMEGSNAGASVAWKATLLSAFSIIFLTGASTWSWIAVFGLLLGTVGSWMAMM